MNPFKRDPPVRLKQSELLVLKELASFFLNVDFQGSQLEELLRARGMYRIPYICSILFIIVDCDL